MKKRYRYLISFIVTGKKIGQLPSNITVLEDRLIKTDSHLTELKDDIEEILLEKDEKYLNCTVIINNVVRL